MTAVDRVRRTQRALGLIVGSSALMWAVAALLALLAITGLIASQVAMPPMVYGVVLPLVAVLVALGTLGLLAWRGRFAWSFDRVALWIEERAPELRYALVTAIDPRYRNAAPVFEPIVSRVDTGRFVRTAATQTLLPAALALAVTVTAFVLMQGNIPTPNLRSILTGVPVAPKIIGNRLTPLTGTLTPPSYANLRTESLDEPSTITGLQGSRVTLTGEGAPDSRMRATLVGTDTAGRDTERQVPITAGGKGWTMSFVMSDSIPAALKLVDRQYSKLIVVDPRVDEPPTARLLVPQRDTTLRKIPETLNLSTDLADDIGIGRAQYEWTIANLGEGDAAEARVGTMGARSFGGAKRATFNLTVPYASLKLKEGDLLYITATVFDNNTLTGPKKGYSETRVIRIARASEYDSLNINPAPPSADTAIMTLRMLIIATEKMHKQIPKAGWPDGRKDKKWVDSVIKLGGKAEIVRQKIQRIIDEQTGGGEIEANPLLVEALNAMWEATRSLYIAETGEAIPQMYIALKALQKYASEKRYYLRGRLPPVVVNIDRVRLAGDDTGKATPRGQVRAVEGTEKQRLRLQYAQGVAYLKAQPARARDIFTLLRVATLRSDPALAAALGEAVTAIEKGTDVTIPLLKARRRLDGSTGAIDSLPPWSGAW